MEQRIQSLKRRTKNLHIHNENGNNPSDVFMSFMEDPKQIKALTEENQKLKQTNIMLENKIKILTKLLSERELELKHLSQSTDETLSLESHDELKDQ